VEALLAASFIMAPVVAGILGFCDAAGAAVFFSGSFARNAKHMRKGDRTNC